MTTLMLRAFDATLDSKLNYTINVPIATFDRYHLREAYIPPTAFNINPNNNVLNYVDDVGAKTVTIPIGYYTLPTLITELLTQMNGIGASGANYFNIVSDNNSTILMFSSATGSFSLDFTKSTGPGSLAQILGFQSELYSTTIAWIIQAPFPPNLKWNTAYYVSINNLSTIEYIGGACTFIVPANTTNGIYEARKTTPVNLDGKVKLRITITDDSGNNVNLQNANWYLLLESC
jgi:hypothetical protein